MPVLGADSPDPGDGDDRIRATGFLDDDLVAAPGVQSVDEARIDVDKEDLVTAPGENLSDEAPADASGPEEDKASAPVRLFQRGGSKGPAPEAELVSNTVASIPVLSR